MGNGCNNYKCLCHGVQFISLIYWNDVYPHESIEIIEAFEQIGF